MVVISRDVWEKLIKIPVKYLSGEIQSIIGSHRSVIVEFVKGEQIEYQNNQGDWVLIKDPAFSEAAYRVHRPRLKFNIELDHDEACAFQRLFKGVGLNSEERRVVTALSEEFDKQFRSAFNKGQ